MGNKQKEQNIWELWKNFKIGNTWVTGISEEEEKEEQKSNNNGELSKINDLRLIKFVEHKER